MKLTFLLTLVAIMQVSATTYSQSTRLTLKVNSATVEELINIIEAQSDFTVFYKDNQLDATRLVNLNMKNATIAEVLNSAFANTDLAYKVLDKIIVITNKEQLQNTITGKITSSTDGQNLPGVNVTVKGTNNGTITDLDGNYSIVADPDATLVFSFMGYVTQEIMVSARNVIDVVMEEDVKSIDEVVVIGYGTIDKKEMTSAISHFNSKDMLQVGSSNPMMMLQGKIPGLTITNTGGADPNSGPSIQLRGASSRDAGTFPLIVIDGVPGGSLDNINQNDIETIDVLKDGAASAIYGTRGSTGVIVITTKKGSSSTITTTYNGYTSFDFATKQLKTLSAEDFVKYNRGDNDGANTDWLKEITRDKAFAHSHSLSMSGGTENSSYRASIDYRNAEGLDLRSTREEYGGRFSLNHVSKKNLYEISVNIAPRYYKRNNANYDCFNQALVLNPTRPVMGTTDSIPYNVMTGFGEFNPVEMLKLEQSGSEAKFIDWNGTFKMNIIKNLSTQVTFAQQTRDFFDFWFLPSNSSEANKRGYKGEANRRYTKEDQKSIEWLSNYSLSIQKHSLKAMVGYSYQYSQNSGMFAENKNFTSNSITYNKLDDGTYQRVLGRSGMDSWKNDSKLISFFGRISYSYAGKYMFTASLRHEGSTKFGKNNKWGDFPAFSAGWRISDEAFMKDISWLNDLKLRGDYGITGNQNFGNYISIPNYSPAGSYMLVSVIGYGDRKTTPITI